MRRADGKALGSDRFFGRSAGHFGDGRWPRAIWAVNFILDEKLTSPTDVRAYFRLVFHKAAARRLY